MPGSGDRAFLEAGMGGLGMAPVETDAGSTHGWVLVRRDRRGLFVPWIERRDVRIAAVDVKHPDWQSGSGDASFHQALRSMRGWYTAQSTDWHQRVVSAIDKELQGVFPAYSVRWLPLMVELLVVQAHLFLLVLVYRTASQVLRRQGRDAPMYAAAH